MAFSFLVSILNHGYFDTFMASRLFKILKQDEDLKSVKSNFQRSNFFKPTFCGNIRQYFIDCLPSKIVCCKKTRMVRSILKARQLLSHEIDILEIIKTRRIIRQALKQLLTKKQRMDLKK